MRAVAVALVVAYHARVGILSGGFVGVDVFFVISGFLITRLLVHDAELTGTVRVSNFWARRLRRLLPMSLIVVGATLIAGFWMLEAGRLEELALVALGAVGFCANVVLHAVTGEYLSGVSLPSPLQHYWSLAVEEQFYLVWPLVVLAVCRWGGRRWKPWLWAIATVGFAGSLWASAVVTVTDPGAGYFLPHTRAWELLVGAALALGSGGLMRLSPIVRAGLGWVGLGALVGAAVLFDQDTVFPGVMALVPVLGTAAVVTGGTARWGPGRVLSLAPLQRLGAWSYSLYLWHWPALVLLEARIGVLTVGERAAVVVGCVALSAATYHGIENPLRRQRWLAARPWRSVVAGATAATLSLGAVVVFYQHAPRIDATRVAARTAGPEVGTTVPAVASLSPAPTGAEPERDEVPMSTTTIPTARVVRVLLVGDSTLASLRWFEHGSASLTGFTYVLDAESCRRLARSGCQGREERIPNSVVDAIRTAPGTFDFIVVMGGYHSSASRIRNEINAVADAVADKGSQLLLLTFKESLAFPAPGSRGERSVYGEFNTILRTWATERAGVRILDWNRFSAGDPHWFRSDGIHLGLDGALGLGWFLSRAIAALADNPCPDDGAWPCAVPVVAPDINWFTTYRVSDTNIHCYEDGAQRERVCERDRLS